MSSIGIYTLPPKGSLSTRWVLLEAGCCECSDYRGALALDWASNNNSAKANMTDDVLCPAEPQSVETMRTIDAFEGQTDREPSVSVCPGLDGVTGVLVRKCNLERMGLVLKNGVANPLVPFKTFQKKAILQDIAKRGKESDWNEHKAIIKAFPLDELVLVRDDEGSYGANYLMPFTEVAFKAVVEKCPFVNLKQELDFALQAVPSRVDRFCQAAGELPKTAEVQHEARLLTVSGWLGEQAGVRF
ncbi:hypothetical protein ACSSS7_006118 [Eimeria intestinalis]